MLLLATVTRISATNAVTRCSSVPTDPTAYRRHWPPSCYFRLQLSRNSPNFLLYIRVFVCSTYRIPFNCCEQTHIAVEWVSRVSLYKAEVSRCELRLPCFRARGLFEDAHCLWPILLFCSIFSAQLYKMLNYALHLQLPVLLCDVHLHSRNLTPQLLSSARHTWASV
jgi:hypothetical protein